MFISIVAPIGTSDLLPASVLDKNPSYPKGFEGAPLISSLVKEYIARGHKVLAITTDIYMDDNKPPFVYNDGLLTYIVVPSRKHTFRFNGNRVGRAVDFYRFERQQITALLNQYKPDVVHAHWTYEFALSALAYNTDSLVTVHDNAWTVFHYVRTLYRFFKYLMARKVFAQGRNFTTVSPYLAESVNKWVSSAIAVIPNPVSVPDLITRPKEKLVIAAIMNGWDERKNCTSALLAFKEIHRRHPEAVLWAMGTAFEPDSEATRFCQEHQIENVVFWGKMRHADVLQNLSASTILLHTALEETFGVVLAEAMSYGIPVVAGNRSGAVPWVVQDGGLLVDVTNVTAIAEAINQLITDSALYARLSRNAVQSIQSGFTLQSIADKYTTIYQKISIKKEEYVK